MVVGGYPESALGKAEMVDLSGQNLNCPPIGNISVDYGSFGTFINNKSLVCGGSGNDEDGLFYSNECFSYNMQVKCKYAASRGRKQGGGQEGSYLIMAQKQGEPKLFERRRGQKEPNCHFGYFGSNFVQVQKNTQNR